jgi:hypothetical protein
MIFRPQLLDACGTPTSECEGDCGRLNNDRPALSIERSPSNGPSKVAPECYDEDISLLPYRDLQGTVVDCNRKSLQDEV